MHAIEAGAAPGGSSRHQRQRVVRVRPLQVAPHRGRARRGEAPPHEHAPQDRDVDYDVGGGEERDRAVRLVEVLRHQRVPDPEEAVRVVAQ